MPNAVGDNSVQLDDTNVHNMNSVIRAQNTVSQVNTDILNISQASVTTNIPNLNMDINVLTEQITRTVTTAVMNNLTAAALFNGQTQNPITVSQPQTVSTVSHHVSPVRIGIENSSALNSDLSSSTLLNSATMSSTQSSFRANVEAAKSGFVSAAIPLLSRVPLKTKEKIWNNELVEFSTLYDEEIDDITISVKSGKITTTNSSKRKFMSIEQWTDAFNVFASVCTLKYPEQSEQLSTYLNTVRKISNENGHWFYYDTNFRKIRQSIGLQ